MLKIVTESLGEEESRRKTLELRCERLTSEASICKANDQSVRAELVIKSNALEILEGRLLELNELNAKLKAKERVSQEDLIDKQASIEVQYTLIIMFSMCWNNINYIRRRYR